MYTASIRRATTLDLPLVASVITTGHYLEHIKTLDTIVLENDKVWQAYIQSEPRDAKILERLQRVPTGTHFVEKTNEVGVSLRQGIVKWFGGSTTKD